MTSPLPKLRAACAFLVLLAPAFAQNTSVLFESLDTKWTHLFGAPNWTDNLTTSGSDFPTVSQLNSAPVLDYTSAQITLQPGVYSIAARVRKTTDQVGVVPITLSVSGMPLPQQAVLPVAAQTTDQWVLTPSLVLNLKFPLALTFKLTATQGAVPIANYQFDSFAIGSIAQGPVMICESLARTWWHAWGSPYYTEDQVDTDAVFGVSDTLNYVWWLEYGSQDWYLPPGTYVFNARVKKALNATNAVPLDCIADVGGTQTVQVLSVAAQTVGSYVLTPDVTFTVPSATTKVRFYVRNIASTYKQNYAFDAFFVRAQPALTSYGTACAGTLGTPSLTGVAPRVGEATSLVLDKMAGPGWIFFGTMAQAIDLTVINMPGCTLLCDMAIALPVTPNAAGTATLNFSIPNDPALTLVSYYNQGLIRDVGANGFGFITSDAVNAIVGN